MVRGQARTSAEEEQFIRVFRVHQHPISFYVNEVSGNRPSPFFRSGIIDDCAVAGEVQRNESQASFYEVQLRRLLVERFRRQHLEMLALGERLDLGKLPGERRAAETRLHTAIASEHRWRVYL